METPPTSAVSVSARYAASGAIAIAPIYASKDLARILEIELLQVQMTVADLTDEQMHWRPNEKAKSALDILCHLAYRGEPAHPANKEEALAALQFLCDRQKRAVATPGKLEEPFTWWTGEVIPYYGVVWSLIRHLTYHLGELVYLRQALGIDEPKYYHEE